MIGKEAISERFVPKGWKARFSNYMKDPIPEGNYGIYCIYCIYRHVPTRTAFVTLDVPIAKREFDYIWVCHCLNVPSFVMAHFQPTRMENDFLLPIGAELSYEVGASHESVTMLGMRSKDGQQKSIGMKYLLYS